MQKKIIISVLAFIFLILISFFLFKKEKKPLVDETLAAEDQAAIFLQAIKELEQRWELGDFEHLFQKEDYRCPLEIDENLESKSIFEHYLRCNPNFLECYFEGKTPHQFSSLIVHYKHKEYQVKVLKNYSTTSNSSDTGRHYTIVNRKGLGEGLPNYGVELTLSLAQWPDAKVRFFLKDTCSQVTLPQETYTYGHSSGEDVLWTTFGANYKLDKFLVTKRDLVEWISYSQAYPELKKESWFNDPGSWPAPASHLSPEQMKEFCAWRGKQLMTAALFDAGTFLRNTDSEEEFPGRTTYPWRWGNSDLKKCENLIAKECELPLISHHLSALSWLGLNHSLGGAFEYLENPFEPKKNLKLSSTYYSRDSDVHKLGVRGFWSESEGFNFAPFAAPSLQEDFIVGFRCFSYEEKQ